MYTRFYSETYRGFEIFYKENYHISGPYGFLTKTNIANFDLGSLSSKDIDELKVTVKKKIDDFLDDIPSTEEGWLKKFDQCVGYDGLIHDEAKHVLRMYKQCITTSLVKK